jgi:thioredoxin-like negative regulator of GroEL
MSNILIHHIRNTKEHDLFREKNKKFVIFFGCENCPSCSDLYPLYQRIAARYKTKIALAYIDVDVCQLDFTTVPYFVSVVNGKIIERMTGATPNELKTFIGNCMRS